MFNNINKEPVKGEDKVNQPDFQKGISQNNAEELRAEFAPRSAVVKTLPDPKSVRDWTQVIFDDGNYRALYLMVNGKWEIITILSPTWDDLRFPMGSGDLNNPQSPNWVTYQTNFRVLEFPTGNSVFFFAQLPHEYLEGSDIEPHVHMIIQTNGAGGAPQNIRWDLNYTWANINDSFSSGSVISSVVDYSKQVANRHIVHPLPTISGRDKKISSMLILKLTRVSTTNNYIPLVYAIELDIHYQKVQWGSIQEFSQVIQGQSNGDNKPV